MRSLTGLHCNPSGRQLPPSPIWPARPARLCAARQQRPPRAVRPQCRGDGAQQGRAQGGGGTEDGWVVWLGPWVWSCTCPFYTSWSSPWVATASDGRSRGLSASELAQPCVGFTSTIKPPSPASPRAHRGCPFTQMGRVHSAPASAACASAARWAEAHAASDPRWGVGGGKRASRVLCRLLGCCLTS